MPKSKEIGILWAIALIVGALLDYGVCTRADELINVKAAGPDKPVVGVYYYPRYGQSVGRFGGTHKALDFLARNYKHAKAEANKVGTAFMPTIAPGYNDTAVRKGHPGRARYFTDVPDSKEGDIFRSMIQEVALPHLDSGCGRVMMVTSFNERYEDSQIEATAGTAPVSHTDDSESGTYYTGGQRYVDYGYLYLDILRQATQ